MKLVARPAIANFESDGFGRLDREPSPPRIAGEHPRLDGANLETEAKIELREPDDTGSFESIRELSWRLRPFSPYKLAIGTPDQAAAAIDSYVFTGPELAAQLGAGFSGRRQLRTRASIEARKRQTEKRFDEAFQADARATGAVRGRFDLEVTAEPLIEARPCASGGRGQCSEPWDQVRDRVFELRHEIATQGVAPNPLIVVGRICDRLKLETVESRPQELAAPIQTGTDDRAPRGPDRGQAVKAAAENHAQENGLGLVIGMVCRDDVTRAALTGDVFQKQVPLMAGKLFATFAGRTRPAAASEGDRYPESLSQQAGLVGSGAGTGIEAVVEMSCLQRERKPRCQPAQQMEQRE